MELIELPILFESRNKVLLVTSWPENVTSQPLFQNAFNLRRPELANIADIMFIKTSKF